jgi:hypothetical protein
MMQDSRIQRTRQDKGQFKPKEKYTLITRLRVLRASVASLLVRS